MSISRAFLGFSFLLLTAAAVGCDGLAGDYVDTTPGGGPAGIYFRTEIQESLASANCLGCHGGGSAPMQLTKSPTTETQWKANYQETRTRAAELAPKGAGSGGHPRIITAASAEAALWDNWAAQGALYEPGVDAGSGGGTGGGSGGGTGGGSGGGTGGGTGGGSAGGAGGGGGAAMDAGVPVTWDRDIRSVMLSSGCTSCHGNPGNDGNYKLGTYAQAMANGNDATPNVIPNSMSSKLITYCRNGHKSGMSAANALKVVAWIVDWGAPEN